MSFLRSLIIAGVVLFAAVYFGSNFAAAAIFKKWLGVPVSVGSVRWGLSNGTMVVRDLRIHNPAGYSAAKLAVVSRLEADYDAAELRRGIFKIKRLKAVIKEVRLEKKSLTETNILELNPVRRALGIAPAVQTKRVPSVVFTIEKMSLETEKVVFETQLGNDKVSENRSMTAPSGDIPGIRTPDEAAVFISLLALQSAGWQTFIPTKDELMKSAENQMNLIFDQLRQKALEVQAQIQQALAASRKTAP